MQIAFKTKNFKITKKIKKYLQDKILKYNRQLPAETFIEVNLEDVYGPKGGKDKKVHLSADVPGEPYISLEEQTSDIFASIDLVFKKFGLKIQKVKGKFLAKRRNERVQRVIGKFVGWIPKKVAFKMPFKKNLSPKIQRQFLNSPEVLTEAEALEKFKKQPKEYIIFRNRESNKVNLISKKNKEYLITEIG